MKNQFRVAHISDLHFGNSHNATAAGHLIQDLKINIKPDIIIVSGDLTDWGKTTELQNAHNFLNRLATECQINPNNNIIVIPGNHDVNNVRGRWNRKYKLHNYACANFPLFSIDSSHLNRYFREFNLAIFGFDSTLTNLNLAEGVIDPDIYLSFTREYDRLIGEQNRDCYKIAVVHHHPLPIPHTSGDHFLMFRKAGDFLESLMHREIDLILYGHKHEGFFSKVRYRLDGRDLEIACAGAGTATQKLEAYKNKANSFNVLYFDRHRVDFEVREARGAEFKHRDGFNLYAAAQMDDGLFSALINTVGIKRKKVETRLKINRDRSEVMTVKVEDLEFTREVNAPSERPFTWDVDGGSLKEVKFENLSSQSLKDFIFFEQVKLTEKQFEGLIKTKGAAPKGTKVSYSIAVAQEGTICLTKEELIERITGTGERFSGIGTLPFEVFVQAITSPMELLFEEVEFFAGYRFRPTFTVFAAGKQQPDMQRALRNCFSFNEATNTARFVVPRPRIGYAYSIIWEPMEKDDLEKMEIPKLL